MGGKEDAELYRITFRSYSEEKLLLSAFFYGLSSSYFMGVFLIKYRIELLFSLPFLAILFTWYLYLGMKPNSIVQNPETLYREKGFMIYLFCVVLIVILLFSFQLPWLSWFLANAFIEE